MEAFFAVIALVSMVVLFEISGQLKKLVKAVESLKPYTAELFNLAYLKASRDLDLQSQSGNRAQDKTCNAGPAADQGKGEGADVSLEGCDATERTCDYLGCDLPPSVVEFGDPNQSNFGINFWCLKHSHKAKAPWLQAIGSRIMVGRQEEPTEQGGK